MIKHIDIDCNIPKKETRTSSSFHSIYEDSNIDKTFTHDVEVNMITMLYNNIDFEYDNLLVSDINKKWQSYMNQDKTKGKYDETNFIQFTKVIEKLFLSNLKCIYCNRDVKIIYRIKRDPSQWTLDRIDNDFGHNFDNVLIACLDCNLKRRCINSDKFNFTKKLNIIKT